MIMDMDLIGQILEILNWIDIIILLFAIIGLIIYSIWWYLFRNRSKMKMDPPQQIIKNNFDDDI